MRPSASKKRVLILLATGFEEGPVAHLLGQLREAGVPVSLVGLAAGLVSSQHGLNLRPDSLLDAGLPAEAPWLVIVPGGPPCAAALMADPRIAELLHTTLARQGYVAALSSAQTTLAGRGLSAERVSAGLITQDSLGLDEFAVRLINVAVA